MKQHINLKQWHELNAKQKRVLIEFNGGIVYCNNIRAHETDWDFNFPNIGLMIEFLGEDTEYPKIAWWEGLFEANEAYEEGEYHVFKDYEGELCDALWEAVKFKLKNNDI